MSNIKKYEVHQKVMENMVAEELIEIIRDCERRVGSHIIQSDSHQIQLTLRSKEHWQE